MKFDNLEEFTPVLEKYKKIELLFLVLILFCPPIFLILFGYICPLESRIAQLITLLPLLIYLIAIFIKKPDSFRSKLQLYGIKRKDIVSSIIIFLPCLLISLVLIFVGSYFLRNYLISSKFDSSLWTENLIQWIIMYVGLSAPLQELIYRGIIQTRLRIIQGNVHIAVIISSVAFGLIHWWISPLFVGLAFVIGLIFGYLFELKRNLTGAVVTHAIIGLAAILLMYFI
ncbi:MAG: lysostaphin resistance A-like protein [Candidatus Helarchaeota archaeon]